MGEIKDFVQLYIQDSDILEEVTNKLAMNLENNIKREAPYDQGRLRRSIRVVTHVYEKYALITGYFDAGLAPHGFYVLGGSKAVEGKLMKMPWGYRTKRRAIKPNDFLGRGLQRTLEAYR
nr:HK97 gp10 family phage protein [uncultured Methanobrevibacter sp.]